MRRFFDERAEGWDERTGAGSRRALAPLAAAVLERRTRARAGPRDRLRNRRRGAASSPASSRSARVRGVDISEAMIREAQRRRSASTPRAGSPSRSPTPPPSPTTTIVRPRRRAQHAAVLRRDRPRPAARRLRRPRLELGRRDALLHARAVLRAGFRPPRDRAGRSGEAGGGQLLVGRRPRAAHAACMAAAMESMPLPAARQPVLRRRAHAASSSPRSRRRSQPRGSSSGPSRRRASSTASRRPCGRSRPARCRW